MKKGLLFIIFLVPFILESADQQNRDRTRDAIFSVVQKILLKSRAECAYELCPNAQLTTLFKSVSGYGIVMDAGLPVRIVTPEGIAPLVDLLHGSFDDVDTTQKFCDELQLKFHSEIGAMPLLRDERLYSVNKCGDQDLPSFRMK